MVCAGPRNDEPAQNMDEERILKETEVSLDGVV